MQLGLNEKIALVTGSDKRTGETIADTLAGEGARVIYHGIQDAPDQQMSVHGDITTETGCKQVLDQVRQLARADFINGQNHRIDGGAH